MHVEQGISLVVGGGAMSVVFGRAGNPFTESERPILNPPIPFDTLAPATLAAALWDRRCCAAAASASRLTPHSPQAGRGGFENPQIWHVQLDDPGCKNDSEVSASCCVGTEVGADGPDAGTGEGDEDDVAASPRSSVILAEDLRNPAQYSVCRTRARSR